MNTTVGSGWAMQQLAGFLAAVSQQRDERRVMQQAVQHVAEAIDAEVCAIVRQNRVEVALGFQWDAVPTEALVAIAAGAAPTVEIPGYGPATATVVPLRQGALVTARSGDTPLSGEERHLVQTMGRTLDLALQMVRSVQAERQSAHRAGLEVQELAAANERLREITRLREDFVSTASHELRTPVTAIRGFMHTLTDRWDALDEADRRRFAQIVRSHADRLHTLIADLLLTSQMANDDRPAPARSVPVLATARELLDLHPEFDVEIRGDGDLAALVAPGDLHRMLLNLVANAHRYGAPPVVLRAAPNDTGVSLFVEDDGPGVPEEFVPRLFDRFSQASTGDRREASGTGLGLAIVRDLANRAGGAVTYRPRRPRGACFELRLPRASL